MRKLIFWVGHLSIFISLYFYSLDPTSKYANIVLDSFVVMQFGFGILVLIIWSVLLTNQNLSAMKTLSFAEEAKREIENYGILKPIDLVFSVLQMLIIIFFLKGLTWFLVSAIFIEIATVFRDLAVKDILYDGFELE